jgi:hypothetical protein
MPVSLQEAIQEQARLLTEDEQREVLHFMLRFRRPERQPQSLGELIDECFQDVPPEVMAQLPADAATNLDHYLYGAPKK